MVILSFTYFKNKQLKHLKCAQLCAFVHIWDTKMNKHIRDLTAK